MKHKILLTAILFFIVSFSIAQIAEISNIKLLFEFTQPIQTDPNNIDFLNNPLSTLADNDSIKVFALFSFNQDISFQGFEVKLGNNISEDILFSGFFSISELITGNHKKNNGNVKLFIGTFKKQEEFKLKIRGVLNGNTFTSYYTFSTSS